MFRDGYAAKVLKGYLSNRRWLLMYLTARFAVGRAAMVSVARWKRGGVPKLREKERPQSYFPDLDVARAAETLRRDGCFLGLQLPAGCVEEIMAFAEANPCHPDSSDLPFRPAERQEAARKLGQRILLGRYYHVGASCEVVRRLQSDPVLLALASRYLGAPPGHTSNRLWWSFAAEDGATETERRRSGQGFHWDMDDYRSITFFFYLTEVDEGAGPHILVRGSHRRKRWRWLWSPFKARTEQEVLDFYGPERIVTICGNKGFGFAEDLFCIHKGSAPLKKDRLILQVRFAVYDYGNAGDQGPQTVAAQ